VPFLGHVWSELSKDLEALQGSDEKGAKDKAKGKAGKKRKLQEVEGPMEGQGQGSGLAQSASAGERLQLVELLVSALHKCFLYAEEGEFITPARFEVVMPPLVQLLGGLWEHCGGDEDLYRRVGEVTLVPCLAQLAAAAGKDVLWRPLNHRLLMRMRDDRPVVRVVALKALRECFVAVGEEYLMMLPESIPFLAELMEDESQEVERLAKDTVRYIEELSGESLESYLA
jgi:U3 small nucleolar RNA-associated protein 10